MILFGTFKDVQGSYFGTGIDLDESHAELEAESKALNDCLNLFGGVYPCEDQGTKCRRID
jgi:hypothetical protein